MERTFGSMRGVVLGAGLLLAAAPGAIAQGEIRLAQDFGAQVYGTQGTAPVVLAFRAEELEQMVAPIALYPDALVSQVLMASTYPLEVVQADRWVKLNAGVRDDILAGVLEQQPWDPSVKSLVNFPQVLTMMSEQLDWTNKLGDAFIAQQADVMNAIQRLRLRAQVQGNLKTTREQTIIIEQPAPAVQIIRIEPVSPQLIYVPVYNPVVVYGPWMHPAYPPRPYYPHGYVATNVLSFGVGVSVGVAWGYAWGGCGWQHGSIDIDFNRNINFNRHINRDVYRTSYQTHNPPRPGGPGGPMTFQHDPVHRAGVSYRDPVTAQRYNRASTSDAARAHEAYRGRPDSGGFGGPSPARPEPGRGSPPPRPDVHPSGGPGGPIDRGPSMGRPSALEGVRNDGSAARAASDRGAASRQVPTRAPDGRSRDGGGRGR